MFLKKMNAGILLSLSLLSLVILFTINIIYFNDVCIDSVLVFDYAANIIKVGRPVVTLLNNLFGNSGYVFSYFPLFPLAVAAFMKIIGLKYAALKVASAFFYFCNIAVIFFFCRKISLIWFSFAVVLLYAFDPLIINDTLCGLCGSLFGFLFLLSFVFFKRGRLGHMVLPTLIGGIFAGLSAITHLFGSLWLFTIVPLVGLFDSIFKKRKKMKLIFTYILPFLAIFSIFILWICSDLERRTAFNMQIFRNLTNTYRFLPFQQSYLKAVLNPIADFYLAVFRSYSLLPFIIIAVLLYTTRKLREYYLEVIFLFVPLFSLIFLYRTESYLVMVAPLSFILMGNICAENKERIKLYNKRITVTVTACILLLYATIDLCHFFHKPTLSYNKNYYTRILETRTEKGATIVTDPIFLLNATEGRRIYSVGILIYYWYRIYHDYKVLIEKLDPDYIILTERMKKWGESKDKFNQREEFQKLLKKNFILREVVQDKRYGGIWIYQRETEKESIE